MFSLTIKGLLAHKLRFALTGVAVILGVAFMAGTFVLTDTMSKSFDDLFATSNQGIDAVVQHEAAFDSNHGTERDRVPAALVDTVAATPGVAGAEGNRHRLRPARRQGRQGHGQPRPGRADHRHELGDEPRPQPVPGRPKVGRRSGPDEVVIDRTSATKGSFVIGDRISVITQAAPHEYTVVGDRHLR